MQEKKSKFIVFDMDGLMFDTERVFVSAWDYAGEKMGIGKAGYKPIMVPDLWQPDEETEKILYAKFEDLEQVKEFLKM